MNKEIELRASTTEFEIRSNEDGQEYFEGYALKFEQWSEIMLDFQEIIDKNALSKSDLSDVRALINHDENYILSRISANNLELEVDGIGLRFRAYPSDTSYSKDLKANMKAGNINKCSFAFMLNWENPDCEKWEYDDKKKLYQRRILDIAKISDVSIVTNPAYKSTEAVISRSLESFKHKQNTGLLKRKLQLELELL